MKIYTRTGDKGETSLISGERFPKSHYIFDILGTIDELNSTLGLLSECSVTIVKKSAQSIQRELFEISANLAQNKAQNKKMNLQISVTELEETIDNLDRKLPPLKNFILSGGSKYAVYLHQCRSICRKTERLLAMHKLSGYLPYFNRLSDLLFVLARYTNMKLPKKDIVWKQK